MVAEDLARQPHALEAVVRFQSILQLSVSPTDVIFSNKNYDAVRVPLSSTKSLVPAGYKLRFFRSAFRYSTT